VNASTNWSCGWARAVGDRLRSIASSHPSAVAAWWSVIACLQSYWQFFVDRSTKTKRTETTLAPRLSVVLTLTFLHR
jgi:hypothetical protein